MDDLRKDVKRRILESDEDEGAIYREHLSRMLAELESGQLPPRENREDIMGFPIADSWPVDPELGTAIIEAEQLYRKA
jgi:hypothetical protein